MTDLQKIELAIRRVCSQSANPMTHWLGLVADQIARDEAERNAGSTPTCNDGRAAVG